MRTHSFDKYMNLTLDDQLRKLVVLFQMLF